MKIPLKKLLNGKKIKPKNQCGPNRRVKFYN